LNLISVTRLNNTAISDYESELMNFQFSLLIFIDLFLNRVVQGLNEWSFGTSREPLAQVKPGEPLGREGC
jgi:hypothetical protein